MNNMWKKLLLMTSLSFISMYALMYMMVDKIDNIYINVDQLYMVLAMTSAMVLIEVIVMGSMYGNQTKIVSIILGVFILLFSFIFTRNQTAISDKEFLKAMIPHHASALLMCDNKNITDIEIQELCKNIVTSQQKEIDWMKSKLKLLNQ